MGQHDLSYRLFFSHARMVCDLLREMIGETWVELIDFASAERVNASFVSEKRRNRESEFQSRPDRYMPVRLMTYTGCSTSTSSLKGGWVRRASCRR